MRHRSSRLRYLKLQNPLQLPENEGTRRCVLPRIHTRLTATSFTTPSSHSFKLVLSNLSPTRAPFQNPRHSKARNPSSYSHCQDVLQFANLRNPQLYSDSRQQYEMALACNRRVQRKQPHVPISWLTPVSVCLWTGASSPIHPLCSFNQPSLRASPHVYHATEMMSGAGLHHRR
jgi:hypothetical protein